MESEELKEFTVLSQNFIKSGSEQVPSNPIDLNNWSYIGKKTSGTGHKSNMCGSDSSSKFILLSRSLQYSRSKNYGCELY